MSTIIVYMHKKIFILILLSLFVGLSYYFYHQSLSQASYLGLPTVPCQDYTKPILQNFSLTITITVAGKPYPLDAGIGHDYGKCLHTIFVNNASGTVYIKSNDTNTYTLGQFFDVWRKTFTSTQIGTYQSNKPAEILVNGQKVTTFRDTPLLPNETIQINYN